MNAPTGTLVPQDTVLNPTILARAKWAFTTRRVALAQDASLGLSRNLRAARPGDLVLGRVQCIGSQKRLQLASGRPSQLYPGDLVVVACGARYAPDQFEGLAKLLPSGADLLASGGVLGRMRWRNAKMASPTSVTPIGLLIGDDGTVVNVADYAIPERPGPTIPVIGAVGASMNSGKTAAAASFAHGLVRAGYRVAAIKATGTGAFGDYNAYVDSGAHHVADFLDAGMVSTYLEPISRIAKATDALLAGAALAGCDVAVLELADGVLQKETAALLKDATYRARFAGFLLAVPDSLSATGGASVLSRIGIRPLALTGLMTQSPMATAEAEVATGLDIASRETLRDPAFATALLNRARSGLANRRLETT
ncbi:MAG: DUF1611 domain-containing protein [Pseudomonadota bacterium]